MTIQQRLKARLKELRAEGETVRSRRIENRDGSITTVIDYKENGHWAFLKVFDGAWA